MIFIKYHIVKESSLVANMACIGTIVMSLFIIDDVSREFSNVVIATIVISIALSFMMSLGKSKLSRNELQELNEFIDIKLYARSNNMNMLDIIEKFDDMARDLYGDDVVTQEWPDGRISVITDAGTIVSIEPTTGIIIVGSICTRMRDIIE